MAHAKITEPNDIFRVRALMFYLSPLLLWFLPFHIRINVEISTNTTVLTTMVGTE